MKFIKYREFWWRLKPNTPIQQSIISTPLKKDDIDFYDLKVSHQIDATNLEIAEANDESELNWSNTRVFNNSQYITGWLSPKAEFFGCAYAYHNLQAKLLHHSNTETLELEGYIKITYNRFCRQTAEYSKYPNTKQLKWLQQNTTINTSLLGKNGQYATDEYMTDNDYGYDDI